VLEEYARCCGALGLLIERGHILLLSAYGILETRVGVLQEMKNVTVD
jgi:hypothetical protein